MDLTSAVIGMLIGGALGAVGMMLFARGQSAAARAAAQLHEQAAARLQADVRAERERAEIFNKQLADAQQEMRARQLALEERTRALTELQKQFQASKAALHAYAEVLAAEVADHGVAVAVVAPAVLDTEANRSAMPDADRSSWTPVEHVVDALLDAAAGGAVPGALTTVRVPAPVA